MNQKTMNYDHLKIPGTHPSVYLGVGPTTRFTDTKTYGNSVGLSCCFRQWRAESHCSQIHGYALGFRFVFGATHLDDKGWVCDFGALKELKKNLENDFDHVLAVAGDDPQLEVFKKLAEAGVARVAMFPNGVGCERFAQRAFGFARQVVDKVYPDGRVFVMSAECFEHDGNSATYHEDIVR